MLCSGGLDSTTCLHKAIVDFSPWNHVTIEELFSEPEGTKTPWVEAVSVDYGQRHRKEYLYAKATCDRLGIKHSLINVPGVFGPSMLTDASIDIPSVSYSDLPQGVSPTYVPYRNGTLLSLITAHAQRWINHDSSRREAGIYFGAHSEDAANWAYPNCTPEFLGAQANAIYIGSYMKIRLYTPLQWLNKAEIIKLGTDLRVDFKNTWSCYAGETHHCGVCPTCRARKEGFRIANIKDPTEYAQAVAA